jgi:hypothetical protein
MPPDTNLVASARPLIEGPSAWIGSDMRNREAEWSHRLSAAEIAEIEKSVAAVQARGLDIGDIRREDFPLPTLGPVLDRLRGEVLDGRGFLLLRGMPVEGRPIAESATAFWGVGIDRCDVVALLCLRHAKSGGLSTIVSSMAVHNAMAERRPDLLERLYRPFPIDRRGEVPEGKGPFYEAPVFNEHAGLVSVLYSRLHIGSSQRFPEARRLTPEDHEALDMLGELAADPELRLDMNFTPGDVQFLHNHTILHARSAYEDWPEAERKRHLLRLWLSPPGERPLPPVFAECYGDLTIGNRGGIICEGTHLHVPLTPG